MNELFDNSIQCTDKGYLLVRDDLRFKKQKDLVESLWAKYCPYADPGFTQKITNDFHARFWEMYLSCALLEMNFKLVPKNKNEGPDVKIILDDGQILWIEAMTISTGSGEDAVPEDNYDEVVAIPTENYFLRFSSALFDKNKKLNTYHQKGIVKPSDLFVIALNGFHVTHLSEDNPPYIVQALYGIGDFQMTFDIRTMEPISDGFQRREEISKKSGSKVSTNVFNNREYPNISGLIYSNAEAFNLTIPDKLGNDFIFVHNRTTINPINLGWLPRGTEYWAKSNKLRVKFY